MTSRREQLIDEHPVKCLCDECLIEKFPECDFAKSGKRWTKSELLDIAPHYKGRPERFSLDLYKQKSAEHQARKSESQHVSTAVDEHEYSPTMTLEEKISFLPASLFEQYKEHVVRMIFYATKPIPRYETRHTYLRDIKVWISKLCGIIRLKHTAHTECNCCIQLICLIPISFVREFEEHMGDIIHERFSIQGFIDMFKLLSQSQSAQDCLDTMHSIAELDLELSGEPCEENSTVETRTNQHPTKEDEKQK